MQQSNDYKTAAGGLVFFAALCYNDKNWKGAVCMKRIFSFVLAGIMVFCLCSCASEGGDEPTVTTSPATEPATTAPQAKDPQLGNFADGVYTNEFVGIRCTVDEQWQVYSDAQLAQLNGLVLDAMTDADLVEQLKRSNVAYLFYAAADNGHRTINVVLENIGVFNGVLLDEKSYVDLSVEQIPAALQSMGLTNVTAEATTVRFAGAKHAAVRVQGVYSGVDFYEMLVCIKIGSYFGVVTVASYHEDATSTLLEMFHAA